MSSDIKVVGKTVDRKPISFNPVLSRDNPSKRYKTFLKEYKAMHNSGDKIFNGRSLVKYVGYIKNFLEDNDCKTLLDYGCGKGHLYMEEHYESVTGLLKEPLPDFWNLDSYYLYDPGCEDFKVLPTEKYDAVICTDVMEHVPEEDLGWVIEEIFSHAKKMVFLNVACFKALKTFKDGTNVHVSIFHHQDWLQFLAHESQKHKDLTIYPFFDGFFKGDVDHVLTQGYQIDSYPRIIQFKEEDEEECQEKD